MTSKTSAFVLALAIVAVSKAQLNMDYYCGKDFECPPDTKNTLCDAKMKFDSSCQSPEYVPVTDEFKAMFLNETNTLRNTQALGKTGGIFTDQAADMATVEWDDELELGSIKNGLQCQMKHDSCRRTAKYKMAGQNLYSSSSKPKFQEIPDQIKGAVNSWYNEWKNVQNLDIVKDFEGQNFEKTGHWSQLVWSNANRIGCSIMKYQNDGWMSILIGCNYAAGNLKGQPMYQIGEATSACKSGKNPDYPGLCNTDEDYSQHPSGDTYFDNNAKPSPVVEEWVKNGKKLDQ